MNEPDLETIEKINELRRHKGRIVNNLCLYSSKRPCINTKRYSCVISESYVGIFKGLDDLIRENREAVKK